MRKKFRIGGILVNDTAKCAHCRKHMGVPEEIITDDGNDFTLYTCVGCDGQWYRPHNDIARPE